MLMAVSVTCAMQTSVRSDNNVNMDITTDRQNVVHVEVNILDKENNLVPNASNRILFTVEGEARIIAVDNGDPLNEEGFATNSRKTFNRKCLVILQSTGKAGNFNLFARSNGLEYSDTTLVSK